MTNEYRLFCQKEKDCVAISCVI